MGLPVTFLSANSKSAPGSAITNLVATETYLVIPWSEISSALGTGTSAPDTLEDWIAAINFRLVDKTLNDTNPQTRAKITPGRRFITEFNGTGLDNGSFESGINLVGYQLTTTIYAPDQNTSRPPANTL